MRTNPIEVLGIIFWVGLPIAMFLTPKETTTEWIVFILYTASSVLSIADVLLTKMPITIAAFAGWIMLLAIGLAMEGVQWLSFLNLLIQYGGGNRGSGTVICILASLSLAVLLISITEEVFVETKG